MLNAIHSLYRTSASNSMKIQRQFANENSSTIYFDAACVQMQFKEVIVMVK